jgi:putative membrane protein
MNAMGIFFRGVAMGAADIVPGVSGGTIAFISGIYPRLLSAIKSVDVSMFKMLLSGDIRRAWQYVDGAFLLPLLLGIACSLLSLARVFSWLLQNYPEPLWGFFFGLILASALVLLKQVPVWRKRELVALVLGVGIALFIALAPRAGFVEGYTGVFLAGFIAICAMILPGISGSFILVLLGMYATVLTALKTFDLTFLTVLILGAGCGLMVFSRILHWLLSHFKSLTIAVLTGFLFGSLATIWPWKYVLSWIVSSSGHLKPAQQLPVSPIEYLVRTGNDPMLLQCVVLAVLGACLIWYVDRRWGQMQLEME